jgi:hypothetical protein
MRETSFGDQCGSFTVYEKSAGRYSVEVDSIELEINEYGNSVYEPPTALVAGTPVRMSFGLRDGALYERGGEEGARNAWKAVEAEAVAQLRELLEKNENGALEEPSRATREPHTVARFQAISKEPFDRGRLTLLSDGTFEFNRTRWDGYGCNGADVPDDLRGWFVIRADEIILVPTTEKTEDWFGDHYVNELAVEPMAYTLRGGTLVAQASQKSPWREYMTPITRLELVYSGGPDWQIHP